MKRRYIFFDYDGTLCSRAQQRIPDSAQEALRLLRANGHFVALATGRLQVDALGRIAPHGIDSLVADGGNSVTIDGELKWMAGMPLDECKAFLHRLDAIGRPWSVLTENRTVRYTRDGAFNRFITDTYLHTQIIPDLDIDALKCVYKMFVPCSVKDQAAIEFGGVTWARYSPDCIYCEPTDKSVGIKKMLDILGAPHEDAIVFGDGTNDRAMFVSDWTCVAMGNAIDDLKARADLVTDHVDEDGVFNACRALGCI